MDYIVSIHDLDTDKIVPIHFVTDYPDGSVGFFEDFYERVEDLGYCDDSFLIVEIGEGF